MGRLIKGHSYWVKNTFVELGVPAADDSDGLEGCRERRAWSADLEGASVLHKLEAAKEGASKEAGVGEGEKHLVPDTPSPLFHPAVPAGGEFSLELALPPAATFDYAPDGSMLGFDGQGSCIAAMMYDEVSGQLLPCSWCIPMEGLDLAGCDFSALPGFEGQDAPGQEERSEVALMEGFTCPSGLEFDPSLFDGSGFGQLEGCQGGCGEGGIGSTECFDASAWEETGAWDAQAGGWEQVAENPADGEAAWGHAEGQQDLAAEAAELGARDGGRRGKGRKGGRKAEAALQDLAEAEAAAASAAVKEQVKDTNCTTVMLRNIPNKYSRDMLVQQLNEDFRGEFDFVYLPIDFKNGCNVGYGFINFRTPELCGNFVGLFDGVDVRKCLPGLNSRKVVQVTLARVQGLEENVRRLRSSPVMHELVHHEDWMPLILDENGNGSPLEPADETLPPVRPRRRGGNGYEEAGGSKHRSFR